jgi:integrase
MARRTNEELWADRRAPRKRGEGSLFTVVVDGQVLYRATKTLYMDDKGRAVQVTGTAPTEQEAIRRRDENFKKRLVKMGELPLSAISARPTELKKTTGEVLWEWLEWKSRQTNRSQRISDQVVAQYTSLIKLHIEPAIGNVPIRLLSRKDIEKMLFETLPAKRKTRKDENGKQVTLDQPLLGKSPLRAAQGVISMACRYALEEKLIFEDPNLGVPKLDKPESKAAEEKLEEKYWVTYRLARILDGDEDEARWLFTFLLAIRQSEKLGLQWSCFKNLDNKNSQATVEIKQQLARNPTTGQLYIKPETKTTAGTRIIPLDDRLVEIIKSYRKRQQEWAKTATWKEVDGLENLVFTTKDGKPIRHQTDSRQWSQLLANNNIPFIRQHAMRHLAISLLITNNQPIEIVRAIAGHHSEAITRATYTHVSVGAKVAPMEGLIDRVFREREARGKSSSK